MDQKYVERAFDSYKPSPPKPQSVTYADPQHCPYCKAQMVRVMIRKSNGEMEPVYLCREDRAVGVVPDNEIQS